MLEAVEVEGEGGLRRADGGHDDVSEAGGDEANRLDEGERGSASRRRQRRRRSEDISGSKK